MRRYYAYRGLLLALWGTVYGLAVLTFVVGVFSFPQVIVLLLIVAVYFRGRKFIADGWTFGTAQLASFWELLNARMLEGDGLLLGKVDGPKLPEAWRVLISRKCSSWLACHLFLKACRRSGIQAWVRTNRGVHMCVVAPSGKGKGQSFVIPTLLTHFGSIVVIDPKGENYRLTAKHREAMGHRVVALDPFRLVTQSPDRFNPLSCIDPQSPNALDEVRSLAEASVIKTGEEREPHWGESAELWIWAVAAWIALEGPPDLRNIQTVCRLLADPKKLKEAIELIRASSNPLLARLGDQLTHYVDRELGSTLTTANRHLRFLTTNALIENTSASTFDPADLRKKPTTIYLIVPTEFLRTQSGLLRMWITSLLRACVKGGADESNQVLFLLDEFASAIGNMPCIEDAVVQLRGYGVRLCFFLQSLGQLERCFPNGGAQTFLACMDVRIFFGLNDYKSAEAVSNDLGDATVPVFTENGGSSRSVSTDHQGLQSNSRSSNDGWSVSHTARRLLKTEEILRLDERIAVVFAVGVKPFLTRLVRAYEPEFQNSFPTKGGE